MDEDEQRRRKVEAGRAKLAQFRQRKAKGDGANPKKKTAKRKSEAVPAPVPEEEGTVAAGAPRAAGGASPSPPLSGVPAGPAAPRDLEQLQTKREAKCQEQAVAASQDQEQECELAAAEVGGSQSEGDKHPRAQPLPPLELEALRLSLSNMHTAQLELTQANLQREKETALVELRDMLNGRHAQELALAQNRQQLELQLEREQHAREREELALRCGQEAAELKEKLQSEMEKSAQEIAALKRDWETERDLCLENLRRELSAKHQLELEKLQSQLSRELAAQKAELEKIFQAKDQAESALQTLEAQHDAAVQKLREDLLAERCQHLQDLELRFREQEEAKQRELEELQASYEELKAQSREEIRRLWAQLASAGGSGQVSSEVQEQLLAPESHKEELEHLKRDFAQQRQREKTEHESELEELRIYFENKLRDAEKSYQEDLVLLQQRLQEVKDDSLLESGEIGSSGMFLEEAAGDEGREHMDRLSLQLEPCEESPRYLHTELEDGRWRHLTAQKPSLEVTQVPAVEEAQVSVGEQCLGPSESSQAPTPSGPARLCLRCARDTALDVEAEVAARVLGLETEHKVKLSLLRTELKEEIDLLKIENRNLHEKLQYEIRLREDLVKAKLELAEDHQEELKRAQERIQNMRQEFREKEAEWTAATEDGERKAEEKLTHLLLELRERAESEKQSVVSKFQLREEEMRQLQAQQAAQILELEASLLEQQGRLRQLELADEAAPCGRCGREPADSMGATDPAQELATLRLKEDCALQLMLAQNRFLEERKKITEKFSAEQDASLREAQEKHASELKLLQEQHQQHVRALTLELEVKHRAEVEELRAAWESEQRALSDARVSELQMRHAAEVGALETQHLSTLDSLEACYVSAAQAVRDEHRQALELLRADLEGQLQKTEAAHQLLLTQELERLQLKHEDELRAVKDGLGAARSPMPPESLLSTAPQAGSENSAASHVKEETLRLELERAQSLHQHEKEAWSVQLQEKACHIQQLKDQIVSLRHELEERHLELETLQQRRERENQEGTALISMLRADADLALGERRALEDALKRLLGLFGEQLKAAVALRSRISERVGLCLEDGSPPPVQLGDQDPCAGPALSEPWPGAAPPEPDGVVPECSDLSSVGDISSHICESFMSPDSTLEWEPPVRRVFQSLDLAVDALLEMVLDSTRQLEEARQTHARFEKEFSCKNEETARLVQKHQELLRHLDEESAASARLTRELHAARGVVEGFKEEQASLREALDRKEMAEQGLVAELEGLQGRLQQEAQRAAALLEENATLLSQREMAAAAAQDREEALQQEVASLSQQQLEARRQSEKDRAALLSQMRVLEADLEEQLGQQQACARQDAELAELRQQMESLDKHLRSQRQFMDEQAVEREHEREDFQQEIRRLEEQLRQAARPQPRGPSDSKAESLQEKLREKIDELSEMALKRELAERKVLQQEEELRRLEEAGSASRRAAGQLQEQLEKQGRELRSLQQDKDALQEQQMGHLLLVSTLQSRLDEARCPLPATGSHPEDADAQLEMVQQVLLQRESEVLRLTEELEQVKADLVCRGEEVLRLTEELEQAFLQSKEKETLGVSEQLQAQPDGEGGAPVEEVPHRSSEIKELKSIIETLQEKQGQLQRERAEEVERLHEVIERLQGELGLLGSRRQDTGDGPTESLQSELDGVAGMGGGAPVGELQAALAARESLSRLLAEQERGHGQALAALQQRLRAAEEAASHTLAELAQLEERAARREAEAQGMAARLRECEARVLERDQEVAALSRRGLAQSTRLEAVLVAFARLRLALEQQPPGEPPELQRLRTQCLRLSRQLKALNLRFLRCQTELGWPKPQGPSSHPHREDPSLAPGSQGDTTSGDRDSEQDEGSVRPSSSSCDRGGLAQSPDEDDLLLVKAPESWDKPGFHTADSVLSVLSVCQRQLEAELLRLKNQTPLSVEDVEGVHRAGSRKGKETPLEACQLQKVDLTAQVEQLQEKLNHLACCMNFPAVEAEGFPCQQPSESAPGQESGPSGRCSDAQGSDTAEDRISWGLLDTPGTQDSLLRRGKPSIPTEDGAAVLGGSSPSPTPERGSPLCLAPGRTADPLKSALRTMDLSSWSSPEVVRKDSTLETLAGLPLTPCSDAPSQHSLDVSLWDQKATARPHASQPGLLCSLSGSAAGHALCWPESPWAADRDSATEVHAQQTSVEKDVEDFIITSLDSQEKSRSPPPALEGKDDGGGEKSDGSGCREKLTEGSTSLQGPTAGPAVPPVSSRRFCQSLGAMKGKELYPKQVKALLQMVCNESHQILALSEYRGLPSTLSKGEPNTPLECFPREGLGQLEVAPALRGPLTPAPPQGEQEPPGLCPDWRGEFLQMVQEAFEKQRETLRTELQSQPQGRPELGPCSSLWERLERLACEQGDLREKSPVSLQGPDRNSLLLEVQALRAQLRLTHLQNQEKLQQLCTALTSAEARGNRQEHQLRRQVELLAYKVEQEKCIASGLQKTLSEEQEKASGTQRLLAAEQSVVRDLRAELGQCRQENERLLASLSDVQKEVLQLRSLLDCKEQDLRAALRELEAGRGQEEALQGQLEEERLRHLQREGQSTKALEELQSSLNKQLAQSDRLRVALKHEQMARDNLQKELRIEASRCEALLAQEQAQLAELQRSLEAERGRGRELSEALQHERLLSRRAQEACAHQEGQAQRALLRELQDEQARVRELQASLEKAQQQAMRTQQRLEAEVRSRCEELQKEKEVSAAAEAPRARTPESSRSSQGERARAELAQLPQRPRECEAHKAPRSRAQQCRVDKDSWQQWQRDKEKLRELELQRQRDQHKVRQLQRAVRELEAQEAARPCLPAEQIQQQQRGLEEARQQLLCAAVLLSSFVSQTLDRTISDWTSSNEKAVASLLHTLEELKAELSTTSPSLQKDSAGLPLQLMDVVLKDNECLRQALGMAAQEKAELSRAVCRLEKTLKHHLLRGCALSKPDRSAWKQDRSALPCSPRHTESGLSPAAASKETGSGHIRMEKLYLHYLRAESFRKALVYQKKYLLLLIGGFQDSEQETLSMIAHLGVFPSKADRKAAVSRPLTRFRTAVRVVVAILRLRFLVKKWQEVDRKGALGRPALLVPRQQQARREASESPPTRDSSSGHSRDPVSKTSPRRRQRSSPSPHSRSSQDPEHSLTEYIHHLEKIQQRLGGLPPDSTSKKYCHQKNKQ
ncbi:pericentrin isoform X4 [Erinaceus europaeus]|uniref:Pericentrin isoform X4 n=1 Tax=Erinaceus europaeus TaxID=9365 RepID=A0ABM3Y170_ERIEU|nr:pericentrin isoform X4 [Erinaceus europaeus]